MKFLHDITNVIMFSKLYRTICLSNIWTNILSDPVASLLCTRNITFLNIVAIDSNFLPHWFKKNSKALRAYLFIKIQLGSLCPFKILDWSEEQRYPYSSHSWKKFQPSFFYFQKCFEELSVHFNQWLESFYSIFGSLGSLWVDWIWKSKVSVRIDWENNILKLTLLFFSQNFTIQHIQHTIQLFTHYNHS